MYIDCILTGPCVETPAAEEPKYGGVTLGIFCITPFMSSYNSMEAVPCPKTH